MCHWTSQVYVPNGTYEIMVNKSNGLSKGHECDRQTVTDRPRYTEKCVGICGIVCPTRAIPPKNQSIKRVA